MRRHWVLACVAGSVGLIALLDFVASPDTSIAHLYYIPIVLAAVKLGRRYALTVGVLCVVLAHFADPQRVQFRYDEADIIQLLLFVAIGWVGSELAGDARKLKRLAATDDLTGLGNLRAFEAAARRVLNLAAHSGVPVSMVCFDVDRLKQLNDTHGHLTGADAVKAVGHVIAAQLPEGAHACRYGGDEFALIMLDCDMGRAQDLALHIRTAVNALAPELDGRSFPPHTLSISAGVASLRASAGCSSDESFVTLFRAADTELYAAKRARPSLEAASQVEAVSQRAAKA